MPDDDADSKQPRRAIRLAAAARVCSGVVGAGTAGAGGYAVFVSDNQAGTTALLLLGGVGLLMALTGRVPERIGREGIIHEQVDSESALETVRNLTSSDEVPEQVREAVATEFVRQTAATSDSRSGTSSPHGESAVSELSGAARRVLFDGRARDAVLRVCQQLPGLTFAMPAELGRDTTDGMHVRTRVAGLASASEAITKGNYRSCVAFVFSATPNSDTLLANVLHLLREFGVGEVVAITSDFDSGVMAKVQMVEIDPLLAARANFVSLSGDTVFARQPEVEDVGRALRSALSRLRGLEHA